MGGKILLLPVDTKSFFFSCSNVVRVPQWLSCKESAFNAEASGDPDSISGLGRSPGEGHGNPLQYSCLKNPKDRGVWRATVHGGGKESDRTEVA